MQMMLQVALTESGHRAASTGRRRSRPRRSGVRRLPPAALLLVSLVAVQLGSALATLLFSSLGTGRDGMGEHHVFGRGADRAGAAVDRRRLREHAVLLLLFGLADACMVLPSSWRCSAFPGVASAITFLGPLGLAVATARRPLHFLWIGIAALGIDC